MAAVLKTAMGYTHRGFESHALRSDLLFHDVDLAAVRGVGR